MEVSNTAFYISSLNSMLLQDCLYLIFISLQGFCAVILKYILVLHEFHVIRVIVNNYMVQQCHAV